MRRLLLVTCASVCALGLAPAVAAAAAPAPVTWCGGNQRLDGDRSPSVNLVSRWEVDFVYVTPADGPDNFAAYASGIATDAAWIDEWWRGQDPTRTPRFDLYPFPHCTTTFGDLDIGFARLQGTAASYQTSDGPARIALSIVASLEDKAVIYYDGAPGEAEVCGISTSSPTAVGPSGSSIVYLQSSCDLGPPGAGGTAAAAAHELIHNLGAVAAGAPHRCSVGHVCDSSSDILWPFFRTGTTLDSALLDVGRDDYYGHSGSWWDVQDSPFLMHLPLYALAASVTGGSGSLSFTIATTPPTEVGGCGKSCRLSIENDSAVSVRVRPTVDSAFVRWDGACAGKGPTDCTLTMTADASTTAVLRPTTAAVSVLVRGSGRVTSRPAGIACPGTCAGTFALGARVRLHATPRSGWRFAGWGGACSGRGDCVLVARTAHTAAARFVRR